MESPKTHCAICDVGVRQAPPGWRMAIGYPFDDWLCQDCLEGRHGLPMLEVYAPWGGAIILEMTRSIPLYEPGALEPGVHLLKQKYDEANFDMAMRSLIGKYHLQSRRSLMEFCPWWLFQPGVVGLVTVADVSPHPKFKHLHDVAVINPRGLRLSWERPSLAAVG